MTIGGEQIQRSFFFYSYAPSHAIYSLLSNWKYVYKLWKQYSCKSISYG